MEFVRNMKFQLEISENKYVIFLPIQVHEFPEFWSQVRDPRSVNNESKIKDKYGKNRKLTFSMYSYMNIKYISSN